MLRLRNIGVASILARACWAASIVVRQSASPTITLDNGTFTGVSTGGLNLFLGIPFAEPPVGDLRFRLPQANAPYTGAYNATAFGDSCIQQNGSAPIPAGLDPVAIAVLESSFTSAPLVDSEDCLSINVFTPANATSDSKLPVIFWIYGGGFEDGSSSTANGSAIVGRAVELGVPAVFVSVNYRLSALGFPGGKEAREAKVGNLGLQDQRLGMRWVQKYISAFGGDPSKVMIWGESAGAISVALQMLTNGGDTEGLFRAGFMNSGSPIPVGPIEDGQVFFDQFVADTNCTGSAGSPAVFDCLREVPVDIIRTAINQSPNIFAFRSLSLAWMPSNDGTFLTDDPQHLVLEGSVADIPFVTGDCDDEGTLFSLSTTNITTDQEFADYLATFYFPNDNATISKALELYPSDPAAGSPFDTGELNAVTPQFKRLAAFQGDAIFQAPRRFFLEQRSQNQTTFAFVNKRLKTLPDLGSFHGSDLAIVFGPGDMTDYLVRFAANLDPNGNTGIEWPQYCVESPTVLTFEDGLVPLVLGNDTYRQEAIAFLTNASLTNPL